MLWGFCVLCGVSWPSPGYAWEIARFETQVTIHDDATATVTEIILADFDGEARHGIYRDIPIHYTDRAGQHFTLRLRVLEVTAARGEPWPYRVESSGRYRRIRIGDPDVTVTGRQRYRIVYAVQRGAIRFFPDHDECYWNLTGNEWAVSIRQVHAEILLPAVAHELRAVAYVGGYGSREPLPHIEVHSDRIELEPAGVFGPYEGLTAAVAWNKGLVHPPSVWQVLGWWVDDNWVYGTPLLVLLGMLGLWEARGRDPRPGRSQVVQYEPPKDLTPAEAGTLLDQRVNLRDVTATVIDLAVRGYLTIEPQDKPLLGSRDYRLVCRKPFRTDASLTRHERLLLDGLFGHAEATGYDSRLVSELETRFVDDLVKIREAVYDRLVQRRYFDSNPDTVRSHYYVLAAAVGGGLWMALQSSATWHQVPSLPLALASGVSALIVLAFSVVMPRRTLKGAEMTDQIVGFVEFLRRTDADRVRRMNDPSLFEQGLPYALAFGVASQWSRAFEGLYTQPPAWYAGQWDSFSARRLGQDLEYATASMGRSFSTQPRGSGGSSGSWGGSGFGGGGFSGGGGGGGGGGAW